MLGVPFVLANARYHQGSTYGPLGSPRTNTASRSSRTGHGLAGANMLKNHAKGVTLY